METSYLLYLSLRAAYQETPSIGELIKNKYLRCGNINAMRERPGFGILKPAAFASINNAITPILR